MRGIPVSEGLEPDGVTRTGVLAPGHLVGGLYKARRRTFRSEPFAVIDQSGSEVTGIWPTGEVETFVATRLRTPLIRVDASVRSHAGRLWALLMSPSRRITRYEELRTAIFASYQSLTARPDHALGVVLDHRQLGFPIGRALELPLESWRVHYEYLSELPPGSAERRSHAEQIIADRAAPSGVRFRVAAAEGLNLYTEIEAARVLLEPSPASLEEMLAAVETVALELTQSKMDGEAQLAAAVGIAPSVLEVSPAARVWAWIHGAEFNTETVIDAASFAPSVVDDLIDRGVRKFDTTRLPPDFAAPFLPEVSYVTYLLARVNPKQLSSLEVVQLGFAEEAYRRYLDGDEGVADALPQSQLEDARMARALRRGDRISGEPHDPALRELMQAVKDSSIVGSEWLQDDRSTWATLARTGVTGVDAEPLRSLVALHTSRKKLFEWDWPGAAETARTGLRTSEAKTVRDELLNLLACAHWMQGRSEQALSALDTALEDECTDELLINAAVVARDLEPSVAIERSIVLARKSPELGVRELAAEKALTLWQQANLQPEDDEPEDVPRDIIGVLRPLIASSFEGERYERILRVLGDNDGNWLASQPDEAFGAYASRPMVHVLKARALSFEEYVKVLGDELRSPSGMLDSWVHQERDSLAGAAIRALLEPTADLSAAVLGLLLVDTDLPMKPEQLVPIICLTVASISTNTDAENAEPKRKFIRWVHRAHSELSNLGMEDRAQMSFLVTSAAEALAHSYVASRGRQLSEAAEAVDRLTAWLSGIPRHQVNHDAVRNLMAPISDLCQETWSILNEVRPLIVDVYLRQRLDAVMFSAGQLGTQAVNIR